MISDIKPIRSESLNCFEDLIISVLNWIRNEHELVFSESWNFHLKPGIQTRDSRLGNRIYLNNNLALLKKYYGIELIYNSATQDIITGLKKEFSANRPVIIVIDSYWCPWDKSYQLQHNTHYCLAVGIDESDSYINCIDAWYMKEREHLPIEDYLKQERFKYISFYFSDYDKNVNWRKIGKKSIQVLRKSRTFKNIKRFTKEIENSLNLEEEVKGNEDIWRAALFTNLESIKNGRINFSTTLDYLSQRYEIRELSLLANDLKTVALNWNSVRTYLIKGVMSSSRSSSISKAVSKIKEIAIAEEQIADKLLKITKMRHFEVYNQSTSMAIEKNEYELSVKSSEPIFLDLTQYLNNNGFGDNLSPECPADLTGIGQYFLTEDLPADAIWRVQDMVFKLPNLLDNSNDNIACQGQIMQIPADYYHEIMLLGCAETGNYFDKMIFTYDDNQIEEITIKFSDWFFPPVYGEAIAWMGKGGERKAGGVYPMSRISIFAKTYRIQGNELINKIVLPNCPNIHLFAISLRK